jgi:hypothetical protein
MQLNMHFKCKMRLVRRPADLLLSIRSQNFDILDQIKRNVLPKVLQFKISVPDFVRLSLKHYYFEYLC